MMENSRVDDFAEKVRADLAQIDDLPIGEHASRLENLHRNLEAELSTIEGL